MRALSFCLFSLFCALFTACSDGISSAPTVTVSVPPLRYFVENIAGPYFQVNTLVPAGASPETYELTPKQVVEVSDSRVYFSVGTLGFERARLDKLTANAPRLTTVNVSDSIPLMEGCTDEPPGEDIGIDLHTWTSVSSGRQITRNVCAALCKADSAHADFFIHRRDSLLHHIDSLEVSIHRLLDRLHERTFIIYHPALGYFARDFGLRQLVVEEDGKEPSAEHLQQLINQAQAAGVKVVFIQKEHAGRAAQRLAEAIGARVVSIAPLSAEWDKQLLLIARALAQPSPAHDSTSHPTH